MDLTQVRQRYPIFSYTHSHWKLEGSNLVLSWDFSIGDEHQFHPSLTIPQITPEKIKTLSSETLDWYTFQLGLVEMLSYWKTTTSPTIEVTAGLLTPEEITWWNDLLIQGLGEFFYQNRIDFTVPDFLTWHTSGTTFIPSQPAVSPDFSVLPLLIPVGGGKDSAVTLKLLTKPGTSTLLINPTQASRDVALASNLPILEVTRTLDPHLLEMNQQDYFNGHTPFSAMAAWVSTLVAHLQGFGKIAVSNERSSNEGNVRWHGHDINHQYSKTFEFERAFQGYISSHLAAPTYFSFLRPLYELQIGQLFAKLTQPDDVVLSRFRSCNRGQKTNIWCGDCAKCLFAYLILRPFYTQGTMIQIFGRDILENDHLYPTLLELVGKAQRKPFDCVGTHEESLGAAYLCKETYIRQKLPLPRLIAQLDHDVLSSEKDLAARTTSILQSWTDDHTLSTDLVEVLRQALRS